MGWGRAPSACPGRGLHCVVVDKGGAPPCSSSRTHEHTTCGPGQQRGHEGRTRGPRASKHHVRAAPLSTLAAGSLRRRSGCGRQRAHHARRWWAGTGALRQGAVPSRPQQRARRTLTCTLAKVPPPAPPPPPPPALAPVLGQNGVDRHAVRIRRPAALQGDGHRSGHASTAAVRAVVQRWRLCTQRGTPAPKLNPEPDPCLQDGRHMAASEQH